MHTSPSTIHCNKILKTFICKTMFVQIEKQHHKITSKAHPPYFTMDEWKDRVTSGHHTTMTQPTLVGPLINYYVIGSKWKMPESANGIKFVLFVYSFIVGLNVICKNPIWSISITLSKHIRCWSSWQIEVRAKLVYKLMWSVSIGSTFSVRQLGSQLWFTNRAKLPLAQASMICTL